MAEVISTEPTLSPQSPGVRTYGGPIHGTGAFIGLTYDKLDITQCIDRVRDHKAGAVVVFIGTTRDNFDGKPVKTLEYTCYPALALKSLQSITTTLFTSYSPDLHKISIVHRLGAVPIGEDSVVITLSTSHRKEGWRCAEECLELVKEKVEIWKREWFEGSGVWRSNRDGGKGLEVEEEEGRLGEDSERPPPEIVEQDDR